VGKNKHTNNLDNRIARFENIGKGNARTKSTTIVHPGAFHKPGSNKK
jgi:hypothetical protein